MATAYQYQYNSLRSILVAGRRDVRQDRQQCRSFCTGRIVFVQYCIAFYSIILYRIVQYCVVLYRKFGQNFCIIQGVVVQWRGAQYNSNVQDSSFTVRPVPAGAADSVVVLQQYSFSMTVVKIKYGRQQSRPWGSSTSLATVSVQY